MCLPSLDNLKLFGMGLMSKRRRETRKDSSKVVLIIAKIMMQCQIISLMLQNRDLKERSMDQWTPQINGPRHERLSP